MGLTLNQRAILFHRAFPEVKITASMLQKRYKKHGIKRKVISEVKTLNRKQRVKFNATIEELRMKMRQAIDSKMTIVYADEVMFTQSSILKREFSNVGQNIEVNRLHFNLKTTAVLAGITEEDGMLINECYPKSVD